ncbi:MAG: hypothetical protein WC137_01320 [Alphaproteobacteria bacterium]
MIIRKKQHINIFKIFCFFLFIIIIFPTYADWCQKSDKNIVLCENKTIPNSWISCGNFNNDSIWCDSTKTEKSNIKDNKIKSQRKVYAGISMGHIISVNGDIMAEYKNQPGSSVLPVLFQQSEFQIKTRSVPIQLSFGAKVTDNLRFEVSYMRYSGISISGLIKTITGVGEHFSFHSNGGDISGNTTMLNAYYNLDRFTGRIIGKKISPYIGAGIGLGTNKISDYEVFDSGHYSLDAGDTGSSNIHVLHSGGTTTNNFVYMIETGGTAKLNDRFLADIFVRWNYLGSVKTDGDVLLTQTVWVGGAPDHDETLNYKNWGESGTLSFFDIGARLRFLF